MNIDQESERDSTVPQYQWEIIDSLFAEKKKDLNKNLEKLKPILKPIARDLYYNRKFEYLSLLDEKNKREADNIRNILRRTQAKVSPTTVEDQLKVIMKQHDIKHPLRGDE